MKKMLINLFEFLSEKARGFLLTIAGTGVGTLPEVVQNVQESSVALETIQTLTYKASFIVALLTIISYGYKFFLFCKRNFKRKK